MLSKLILSTLNIISNICNSDSSSSESDKYTESSKPFTRQSLRFFSNINKTIIPPHQLPGNGLRIRFNFRDRFILRKFEKHFNSLNRSNKSFILTEITRHNTDDSSIKYLEKELIIENWIIKIEKNGNNKGYIMIEDTGNNNIFTQIFNENKKNVKYVFSFLYKDENNIKRTFSSNYFLFKELFNHPEKSTISIMEHCLYYFRNS